VKLTTLPPWGFGLFRSPNPQGGRVFFLPTYGPPPPFRSFIMNKKIIYNKNIVGVFVTKNNFLNSKTINNWKLFL